MVLSRWNRNSFKNFLGLFETSLAPSKTYPPFCSWNPQPSLLDTSHFSGRRCPPSSAWRFSYVFDFYFPSASQSTSSNWLEKTGHCVHRCLLTHVIFSHIPHLSPCKLFPGHTEFFHVAIPHFPQWSTSSLYLENPPFFLVQMSPPQDILLVTKVKLSEGHG